MPFRDVEDRRAYQREWTRARRSGLSDAASTRLSPTPEDQASAAALLGLLWAQLAMVRDSNADPLARARCIGYLAAVTLRATETASLEARLAALEQRFGIGGSNGHHPAD